LHLWHWVGDELKALGARCLEPPPQDFGSDADLLHIGIAELQALLLKTSLLLGVQILFGTTYSGHSWTGTEGWAVSVRCNDMPRCEAADPSTAAAVPMIIPDVAVLVGAGGLGSTLGRTAGLETVEIGSLRSEEAIGLVCNFLPTQSGGAGGDRSLRSFSLARQFYEKLFLQLQRETGAELENIVYTRSKASHYFIMTPTRRCLLELGILLDPSAKPALGPQNIDHERLDAFVRRIVAFRFKEGEATLPEAAAAAAGKDGTGVLRYADGGPGLFDFSSMKRAADGLTFLPPPRKDGVSLEDCADRHLLVALAGDALIEPFWPEGLGIVRGFLGVLDVAYAAARWACGADRAAVCNEFAASYCQLKSLAAATRCRVLRDDESAYGLAPGTRYRGITSVEVLT